MMDVHVNELIHMKLARTPINCEFNSSTRVNLKGGS